MFDEIIAWFEKWWKVVQETWQEAWDWCKGWWTWLTGLIISAIAIASDFIQWFGEKVSETIASVQSLVIPGSTNPFNGLNNTLATINVFFPLNEVFTLTTAFIALLTVCLLVRMVRWVKGLLIA